MAHTVVKITYNPNTAKIYFHNISPTQVTIEIAGENTSVSGVRARPLLPSGDPVPDTEEVTATL